MSLETDNILQLFDKSCTKLLNDQTFLSSGCPIIDKALRGGFPKQGITQIYGQAGSGKSQIALQLCLSVQQIKEQDKSYGAVYICTEALFPVKRLQQMLRNSQNRNYSLSTDVIFVEHIDTADNLETYLSDKLPMLLNNCKIGVIIIDSIAAPFAGEYANEELKNRAIILRKIGFKLHNLSSHYNLAVICINQVRADLSCDTEVPALGITWEHAVTNSICIYKTNSKRFARVVSSPYLPQNVVKFEVNDSGIAGVKEL